MVCVVSCVLFVRVFHVGLVNIYILHRSVQLFVSKNNRDFLNRHPVLNQHRSPRPAKPMCVYIVYPGGFANDLQDTGNAALVHPPVKSIQEERGIVIRPLVKIFPERHRGNCVYIDTPLFVSLSKNNAFQRVEVNVLTVQANYLADAASCGEKEAYKRLIPFCLAVRFQLLQINIRVGMSYFFRLCECQPGDLLEWVPDSPEK